MDLNNFIKKYDKQNQLDVLKNSYQQLVEAWNVDVDLSEIKKNKFSSIIFCGLGGSAISGDLLSDYLMGELHVPFIVVRGYHLPSFVNENSLVIISSYSGNTEETISCFDQALKKKSKIIVITSGGKIGETASVNKIPVIRIRSGFQPRYALGLSFFSALKIIHLLGFSDETKNSKKIIDLWQKKATDYSSENNNAFIIAEQLIGFIPVIYSAEFLSSTGYRMKSQFNENAKLHAFHHTLPEMNHNEIIGWESYREKQFQAKIIYLLDKDYHPQNKKRFEILKDILSEQKADVITIASNEDDKKVRIMDLIFLADWISFYTAVLRGFDPSEIDFIDRMKQRIS